jgi:hypothetical protein
MSYPQARNEAVKPRLQALGILLSLHPLPATVFEQTEAKSSMAVTTAHAERRSPGQTTPRRSDVGSAASESIYAGAHPARGPQPPESHAPASCINPRLPRTRTGARAGSTAAESSMRERPPPTTKPAGRSQPRRANTRRGHQRDARQQAPACTCPYPAGRNRPAHEHACIAATQGATLSSIAPLRCHSAATPLRTSSKLLPSPDAMQHRCNAGSGNAHPLPHPRGAFRFRSAQSHPSRSPRGRRAERPLVGRPPPRTPTLRWEGPKLKA